ncbi:enoyl-CoA hydratase/isomerase family protein [Knoellia koreensis]|jgi:2-(1,2-epoxy-1,2-dihydrophenyl)acetyl-CoA isomerase|uniref:Enoyl-CoA hydratase n=1 Tax=Knoellia koreensis TaxID=2730921 RepID=A0A849HK73_9MICO|nr:enoyl-CoA hydratase-related protein [Knoellia sp. DB2414S]NNM47063.1 enoyl-CoA hydratase [Knoellia sp. DB2414S]
MIPQTLRLTVHGPVATVELTRPERRNALNPRLAQDLLAALAHVAQDQDVRVIVLTGAGGSFCAGADLTDLDPDRLGEAMVEFNKIIPALRDLPQPVIAKVRGAAVGAGCNLALACDFVIADQTARFTQIFPRLGLSIDLGGSWVLPRLVGLRQARELALLGDDLDGPAAAQVGLITRCVPADELDDAVTALARRLAGFSRAAQARTKHLLDLTCTAALTEALAREAEAQVANASTPEFHQALNDFRTRHQGAQP